MKETCAVKIVSKTPGRLSEEGEREETDPLQRPIIHHSDEIEADESKVQGESGYQPNEIKMKIVKRQIDLSD